MGMGPGAATGDPAVNYVPPPSQAPPQPQYIPTDLGYNAAPAPAPAPAPQPSYGMGAPASDPAVAYTQRQNQITPNPMSIVARNAYPGGYGPAPVGDVFYTPPAPQQPPLTLGSSQSPQHYRGQIGTGSSLQGGYRTPPPGTQGLAQSNAPLRPQAGPGGLLAQYFDEAANHARAMKLAPPKPKKITQEEQKRMDRAAQLPYDPFASMRQMAGQPPLAGAPTFVNTGSVPGGPGNINAPTPMETSAFRSQYRLNRPVPGDEQGLGLGGVQDVLDAAGRVLLTAPNVSHWNEPWTPTNTMRPPRGPGLDIPGSAAAIAATLQSVPNPSTPQPSGIDPWHPDRANVDVRTSAPPAPWQGPSGGFGLGSLPFTPTMIAPRQNFLPEAVQQTSGGTFQNPNRPSDTSPESRLGYGAVAAQQAGRVDGNGRFTEQAWSELLGLGAVDPSTGAWLPSAAGLGIVPETAVGKIGSIWLNAPGAKAPATNAPPASEAGQPFDANAVLPASAAPVAPAQDNGGGGGGTSGGKQWVDYGRGGGGTGGGGGYGRSYGGGGGGGFGRRSRGGFAFGDDDEGGSWEDFRDDFDGDGDIDEKDDRKAKMQFAMRKKTRRGKRGGKGRSGVPAFPESPIRSHILSELTESLGRPVGFR